MTESELQFERLAEYRKIVLNFLDSEFLWIESPENLARSEDFMTAARYAQIIIRNVPIQFKVEVSNPHGSYFKIVVKGPANTDIEILISHDDFGYGVSQTVENGEVINEMYSFYGEYTITERLEHIKNLVLRSIQEAYTSAFSIRQVHVYCKHNPLVVSKD